MGGERGGREELSVGMEGTEGEMTAQLCVRVQRGLGEGEDSVSCAY